jgi:hypothetical protein
MSRTYLHFLQSAEVFRSGVSYQNEAVGLGLGIGTGETTVAGISQKCNVRREFASPNDSLDNLW